MIATKTHGGVSCILTNTKQTQTIGEYNLHNEQCFTFSLLIALCIFLQTAKFAVQMPPMSKDYMLNLKTITPAILKMQSLKLQFSFINVFMHLQKNSNEI